MSTEGAPLPDDVEDVSHIESRPAADVKHLVAGLRSQCFLGERAPPSDVARAVDHLELCRGRFVEIELIPHWPEASHEGSRWAADSYEGNRSEDVLSGFHRGVRGEPLTAVALGTSASGMNLPRGEILETVHIRHAPMIPVTAAQRP